MPNLNRLSVALNIRAGEGRLVSLLLIHSFFIGLAKIFTSTAAGALFIDAYSAQALPYVYIGVAMVVSLIGFGYTRLEGRLSFRALLGTNLIGLLVGLAVLRLLVGVIDAGWPTAILMIWFEVIWALTSLEFWGLAGRLFDLRQGKRLFGLIGSGDMVAVVLSGFTMTYVVGLLGTKNLLFVAMVGLAGSLLLLFFITRLYHDELSEPAAAQIASSQSQAPSGKSSYGDLFKNRYIALVFALAAISLLSYYVVDNAFFDRAQVRYTNTDQLAAFMGNFLASAAVASLVLRVVVTGPFMERFGLLGGLLSLPVMVSVGAIAVIFTGTGWGAIPFVFWLTTGTKLFDSSLRFSIFRSGTLVLYQPLSARQQVQVQTAVESFVEPAAGGVAGLLLLFLGSFLGWNAVELYYLLAVVLAVWFVLVFLLNKEYAVALTRALAKRRLGGDLLALTDGSSLAVLQQGLNSSHVGQVIYALDVLEEIEHESLTTFLRGALRHPAPAVRQEALRRIEQRRAVPVLRSVRLVVRYEQVSEVRAAALRTLAALGGADVIEEVKPYLDDPDMQVRREALVGLLRSGGIEGVLIAGQRLLETVSAPHSADRIFAARVLGEVGISSFYQPLQTLLQDTDPRVQRAALRAVGQLRPPQLWPQVIQALSSPDLSSAAASALVAGGEAVVPQIRAAFAGANRLPQTRIRLARVCGRIQGESVIDLLKTQMDDPDENVRLQILKSLSLCGYRAGPAATASIEQHIRDELSDVAWTLAALVDIGQEQAVQPLARALHSELEQNRVRLFLLLSFIYDSVSILQARDILLQETAPPGKKAYALEVIDIQVGGQLKPALMPLLDDTIPLLQKQQQLAAMFPQQNIGQDRRIGELITRFDEWVHAWTVACAVQSVADLALTEAAPAVVQALSAPSSLVRETAMWTLVRLDAAQYWPQLEALSQDSSPQVRRALAYLHTIKPALLKNGANITMLSTLEKVFVLKAVDIFVETPEDALAEIASIVEEVEVQAGAPVFEKGDTGTSMYVIFNGRVRVHDGDHTLNELSNRDIFGEMALLESELRSASVTALEDTHLLRLDQAPFYELVADRSEVAWGIIRVLTRRVRDLSQKLAGTAELSPREKQKPGKSRDALLDGIMNKLS